MHRLWRRLRLLLLVILPVTLVFAADTETDYLVIKLDSFPQKLSADSSGFSKAVLAAGVEGDANNQEILPVTLKAYPLGMPLQVVKSYVPGNAETLAGVNQFLVGTTNRYVPEVILGFDNSFSSAEYIDRLFMDFYCPVSNNLTLGLSLIGGIFDLVDNGDQPSISTGLIRTEFQARYRFSPEFNLYGGLVVSSSNSVVSPGLRARLEYVNRGGIELKLSGMLWDTWAENTIGVYNNGRQNGLLAEATLPLTYKLRLDLNTGVDFRYTTKDTFSMKTYEGTYPFAGGRLTWDFFKREYRQLPKEFLSADYLSSENIDSKIGLYARIQASKYYCRNEEVALIPVVDESVDQRIGLSASYAFTSRLATTADLYVGYDPARDIGLGKLYGFDTRLIYIPSARTRIYGTFALNSEAPTGLAQGSTWYYGAGFNYKF